MDNQRASTYTGLEIAIIGMSGRFPGAGSVEQFWRNLCDGVESITFLTDEELEAAGVSPSVFKDPAYVRAKGVLEGVELFDAAFFGYSPREAEIIDPQQRIFLECAWEAFDNAGYNTEAHKGLVGVYAGVGMNTYLANIYSDPELVETVGGLQIGIGSDKDYLTTRVSYKLNLEGPSVVVQAACSTSLVAVHLAAQALLNGDCDMALAGGVTAGVPQKAGYIYQEGGTLSPDGHCRAFDARAQGMVVGNGAGVVVLKRLEDALADGDNVRAVIRGSAVNNDGALKVGYGAPRAEAQARATRAALRAAEVEPETLTYVEAHGTGTELGDPIEIAALSRALRTRGGLKNFCAIGSVKTNVGHLDTASGMASLIKVALSLEHGQIPPSLHFNEPNPQIDFANSPFYVNTSLAEWETNGHPRRAGINSYAIGGTNAHLILEEAPAREPSGPSRPSQLLVLSARTAEALESMTSNLAGHLRRHPGLDLADVAFTLQTGRRLFAHRRALVCRDADDALRALEAPEGGAAFDDASGAAGRPVVFVFPGEGAPHAGAELYRTEPTFREHVDRCAELLAPHLGADVRESLYPASAEGADASRPAAETSAEEPALFVVEYALAQLWISWGVRPASMTGEGVGELVAAHLAGVFTLEEALSLAVERGRVARRPAAGAMTEAVGVAEGRLAAQGAARGRANNSYDFEAEASGPAPRSFVELVEKLDLKAPQIPFISHATGTWVTDEEAADVSYWARNLRPERDLAGGFGELFKEPETILLEVGPGRALSALAAGQPGPTAAPALLSTLPAPAAQTSEAAFLLETLGRLYVAGAPVDWSGFYAHERRRRVPLPSYPFERQRHWVERRAPSPDAPAKPEGFAKKSDVAEWLYAPSWKRTVVPYGTAPESVDGEAGSLLIFVGGDELGAGLAQRLAAQSPHAVTVEAGEQFSEISPERFSINPRLPDDYDSLISRLIALEKPPANIIHLWNLAPGDEAAGGVEGFGAAQDIGYFSLLYLAQSLAVRVGDRPVDIQVVSSGAQDVTGEEELSPAKATLLDPCRAIPRTLPNISCRSVDVTPSGPDALGRKRLADHLFAELTSSSADRAVAYRGNNRWVQTYEPVPPEGEGRSRPRLRFSGTYLITGGLGRIGMVLAEYLAQTLQSRLVLTSRSHFPEREEWEQWLSGHEEGDEVSRKIRRLQALEEMGAEVLTFGADVADEERMREVLDSARRRFGALHGVIHAAGGAGARAAAAGEQAAGETEYERLVRSKVHGPAVLARLLGAQKPDFYLLFSSLSAVVSGTGFTPLRAADLFMDAYARRQQRTSATPWVSVNWDAWQFGGGEHAAGGARGFGLTPREGVEVFRRVLSIDNLSQLVVSAVDLRARFERAAEFEALMEAEARREARRARQHGAPDSDGDAEDLGPIEKKIAEIWSEVLKVDNVGIYDNFFELGGQSILAIQVIRRINQAFEANLSMRAIFDEATVAGLALLIEEALIEKLAAAAAGPARAADPEAPAA